MEPIKEKIHRFREWQEQPYEYRLVSDEVQHCNNCGKEYTGNFCPICSQKAGMGRIGWRSVRQGIMDIWGLGTRSLLYSIWQLLLRPGHIISDYIDGKRQVSFPPVKMLFIVAVVYSMIYYWLIPEVLGLHIDEPVFYKEQTKAMASMISWMKTNYSWFSLIMAVLAVVPTWVLFRYSPRHTEHSLPEGFFIQVFLAVLMIVFGFLFLPLAIASPLIYTPVLLLIYGIYYIIVYKYLFGYGLWGTLWRCGFILAVVYALLISTVFMVFEIDLNMMFNAADGTNKIDLTPEQQVQARRMIWMAWLMITVFIFAVGYVINMIVTRNARKQIYLEKVLQRPKQ